MEKTTSDVADFEPPSTCRIRGASGLKKCEDDLSQEKNETPRFKKAKIVNIRKVPGLTDFRSSSRASAFRKRFFPDVTQTQWNDWHWQLRNRITHLRDLQRIITLSEDEIQAISHPENLFPVAITPYYASLLARNNPTQPLRRTVIPVTAEQLRTQGEAEDPLDEETDSPVPGLVHRYPDRVLFLTTGICSTYCRYCTRSRAVGHKSSTSFNTSQIEGAIR
ncbi:MAG: hypothetical protein KJ823_07415, partial [Proteobacteria bacterium]|nr:hypothetical protein [Pseudomonadota bacterium]